jgi:uncharacterized protein YqjF (DUF2071 family)
MPSSRPFLTARWEHLVLLNYVAPASLVAPLVPAGTELDAWNGDVLVSLVGFHFVDTRVHGVAVPGHRRFEEVNLRFYVRRTGPDGDVRRAVVFVREVVPRRAVALIARWTYNEPYVTAAMSHAIACDPASGGSIAYRWHYAGEPFQMSAAFDGSPSPLVPGSEAEFVTEHYWGYTRQRDGGTLEYRVEHPSWAVWTPAQASFSGPAARLYGAEFGALVSVAPRSAYVALGSEVAVFPGARIA